MKYFIPQGTEVEVYQYDNEKFLNFEFLVIKTNKDNSFNEEQKSLSTAKRNYYIFKEGDWLLRVNSNYVMVLD